MKKLINYLYQLGREERAVKYLQTLEYRRAIYGLDEAWEGFRSGLTEEQEQKLNELLAQESAVENLEDEASFLAGVAIGLDLGRL